MSQKIKIRCAFTKMVPISDLKAHPMNPYEHNDKQIQLLAEIIKHQGWRNPIKVSKRSGFVVAGHARLKAGTLLGMTELPVDEQSYRNEADELADIVSDNKIAEMATVNGLKMADIFIDLDEENFDMNFTGFEMPEIENIVLGPETMGQKETADSNGEEDDSLTRLFYTFTAEQLATVHCSIASAMESDAYASEMEVSLNKDDQASAIAVICANYNIGHL